MKIVSLNGSFRQNGNTALILKLLEEKLAELAENQRIPLTIESVNLAEKNLQPCRGCRKCFDKGENFCPAKDDFLSIRDRIMEADCLILASPVYVEDVSGMMKNWIDRMAFYSHRPALFGKYAVVIATSGSGSSRHSLQTMANALTAWGCRVLSQNKFKMGAKMQENQARQLYDNELEKLAKQVFHQANKAVNHPPLYSLIAFQIQKKIYRRKIMEPTADVTFWKQNGWLEPKKNYYTDIPPHTLKTILAKAIAGIVIRFILS